MVLSKRNENGEFVVWNGSSQASNNSHANARTSSPPMKKARLEISSNAESSSSMKNFALDESRTFRRRSRSADVEAVSSSSKTPLTTSTKSGYNDVDIASSVRQVGSNMSIPNASPPSVPSLSAAQRTAEIYQGSSLHQIRNAPPPALPTRSRRTTAAQVSTQAQIPIEIPRTAQPSAVASTSVLSSMQPTPAPNKRGRKKAAEPVAKPEKRGAIFKKKCPQNILDRVERVRQQRIFMIDRNRVEGELKEEFSVLGSTGNVYTVVIDHRPRCNCPDASKGNHCKHILFIFLKVLQVTQASGYWYQKALLTSELEDIFAHAPLAPNSMAHPHVRDAYARATGKAPSTPTPVPGPKKRLPGPDDDCPVCYDGMHGVAETLLVFCADCGNTLHKECFQQWQRTAASSGKNLTCVWCRAPWAVPHAGPVGGAAGGARRGEGGYLNLAGVGGVSPVRDTSTYYHGPRRGKRHFGYQYYPDD